MDNYSEEKLKLAIATMRKYCDEAERYMEIQNTDLEKANQVMHSLSWGLANSSTYIEAAISNIDQQILMEGLNEKTNR